MIRTLSATGSLLACAAAQQPDVIPDGYVVETVETPEGHAFGVGDEASGEEVGACSARQRITEGPNGVGVAEGQRNGHQTGPDLEVVLGELVQRRRQRVSVRDGVRCSGRLDGRLCGDARLRVQVHQCRLHRGRARNLVKAWNGGCTNALAQLGERQS